MSLLDTAHHHLGPKSFQRILATTDFTPASKHAFRKALALGRNLGAELHLLHVGHAPHTRPMFFIPVPHPSTHAIGERLREKARKRFETFLRGEELGEVRLMTVYREGHPHAEISAYAAEHGMDLIVLGERHETRAQHLLQHLAFESVGERVRREAPCPVLTVR